MRPAVIKTRTNRGIYYVIYPPAAKKSPTATDQLRIAIMYRNKFNELNKAKITEIGEPEPIRTTK